MPYSTPAREASELTPAEIQVVLDRNGGNQAATWRELGLRNRDVLYRLIRKHHLVVRKGG